LLSDAEKAEMAVLFRRLRDGSTETPPGMSLKDALAALSQSSRVCSVLAAMVRLTSIVHAPDAADGLALLDQLQGDWVGSVGVLSDAAAVGGRSAGKAAAAHHPG
jgi:hypothetical protein